MFERRFFLVAPSFHGATLLSGLMNAHPGVVGLGDTYPSNRFDQVCGCGEHVSRCGFWQAVAERVGADRYRDHPQLLPMYPRIVGGRPDRWLYNTLPPALLKQAISAGKRAGFADDFEAFAGAVHEFAGKPDARVFVDGVKSIARVQALIASGAAVDGVIHLLRDPGDFAKSAQKNRGGSRRVFLKSALSWRLFHNRARRFRGRVPYLSLCYEGLAEHADESLQALFSFLGVAPRTLAELNEGRAARPWHFMGNASLFQFDGTVRRSRHDLSRAERAAVRLLAGHYREHVVHVAGVGG